MNKPTCPSEACPLLPRLDEGDRRFAELTQSIADLSTKVDSLRGSVEGMVQVWTAGKAGYGVAKWMGNTILWIGKVAIAIGLLWATIQGWFHLGPK